VRTHNKISRPGNTIGELFVIAIVLYFAWRAGPMLDYSQRLVPYLLASEKEALSHAMGYLFKFSQPALSFLTLALPAAAFFPQYEQEGIGSSLAGMLITWAALGWWIGRSFDKAYAAKVACKQSSVFGFGCNLDGPVFSLLAFSVLSLLLSALVGLFLIGALLGRFDTSGEKGDKSN